MRFEQVLRIYWTKGLFYNATLHSFDLTVRDLFVDTKGFNWGLRRWLVPRYDLYKMRFNKKTTTSISYFEMSFGNSLNLLLSQITSINNQVYELHRVNLIRLYLVKSTRGRSHALGKPSRGQRTWSNAWNAYKLNNVTRDFISSYQKILQKDKGEVRKDFRKVEKRVRNKERKRGVSQEVVKVNFWF